MNVNLFPFAVTWALLATVVLILIVYRLLVSRKEDDTLHVLHQAGSVTQQVSVAQKLERIDRWGKVLTVLAIVYGAAIAGLYLYRSFVQASTQYSG